jgi:hypothetical protein
MENAVKKILVFTFTMFLISPAYAGHDKAPTRLGIPPIVAEYLHQFGDLYTTIVLVCHERLVVCLPKDHVAMVAFYDSREARDQGNVDDHYLGTAIFEVEEGEEGRLGKLLRFFFGNGRVWTRGADPEI